MGVGIGRAGIGIGGAGIGIQTGVCLGIGVGGITLGFLLSPALPCPILGLGMGIGGLMSVDSLLSIGCVCCVGSIVTDFCCSGLTCGFKPLSMP